MPRGRIASKSFPPRRLVPQSTQRLRLGALSLRSYLYRYTLNFNHNLNSCYQCTANLYIRLSIYCGNRTLKPHSGREHSLKQSRLRQAERIDFRTPNVCSDKSAIISKLGTLFQVVDSRMPPGLSTRKVSCKAFSLSGGNMYPYEHNTTSNSPS
jgi:hypothetical protein